MHTKTVKIEIEIPIRFEVQPESPGYYKELPYPARIYDLDWNDLDIQKEVIKALYDPGLHDELIKEVSNVPA